MIQRILTPAPALEVVRCEEVEAVEKIGFGRQSVIVGAPASAVVGLTAVGAVGHLLYTNRALLEFAGEPGWLSSRERRDGSASANGARSLLGVQVLTWSDWGTALSVLGLMVDRYCHCRR